MKTFYRPVDCRSRKGMTGFLEKHYRYPAMNSWNPAAAYACNLKIHQLSLDGRTLDKLFGLIQMDDDAEFSQWSMDQLRERVRGARI